MALVAVLAVIPSLCRGGSPPAKTEAAKPNAGSKDAPYRFAYKFAPNQDVHMDLIVKTQVEVQKGPFKQAAKNESHAERHFHVVSVTADGVATLELYIDSVKLTNSFDNSPAVSFDSRSKVTPPQFENVRDCIGKLSATMKVDRFGKLVSILRVGLTPTEEAGDNFLDVFPDRPLRIGDEWTEDIKVPVRVTKNLQQKITLRRRYRLTSVEGHLAKIHVATSELTQVDDPVVRAQLVQKTPEGTIVFDMERGLVTSRELRCIRTETGVMGEGSTIASNSSLKGTVK